MMTLKHLFPHKIISEFQGMTEAEVISLAAADIIQEQGWGWANFEQKLKVSSPVIGQLTPICVFVGHNLIGLRDFSLYQWLRWTRSTDDCDDLSKYCTKVSNYPDFLTRSLLTKHPALNGNTGNLFKQVFDGQCENTRKNSIGTRFFTIEDEQLCVGRQKVIFPKKALNLNNEWKFVVNIDNFTQAVEVEECEHSYSSSIEYSSDTFGSCLYAGSSGKNPRLTACKQIYTEYKLLALSSSETNLEVDSFLLPSACACYISGSLNNALELLWAIA